MSHFIGLALLPIGRRTHTLDELQLTFKEPIEVTDIRGISFGKAVGATEDRLSVSPLVGGTSTDLLGLGSQRAARVDEFRRYLSTIFGRFGGFALLVHFFRGRVDSEPVTVRSTVRLSLEDLLRRYPSLDEDVRYVVTWSEVGGSPLPVPMGES